MFLVLSFLLALVCVQVPTDAPEVIQLPGSKIDAERVRAKARAMLLLEQAKRERVKRDVETCGCGYGEALAASVKANSVLVCVVGATRHDLDAMPFKVLHIPLGCHDLPQGVIVSQGGKWLKTLPTSATARDVEDALRPRVQTSVIISAPPAFPAFAGGGAVNC